jgi:hypothetical protein
MRCTVPTLTPCVAAITRTPGRLFLRSVPELRVNDRLELAVFLYRVKRMTH